DGFVQDLQSETGLDVGYSTDGLICVASSEHSADVLQRRYQWQKNAGFDIQLLSPAAVHELEPLVTAPICAAVFLPGDRSVTPRRLVNALREACVTRGVEIRTGLHVECIAQNQVRVGHMILEAANIVIASGVWSPELSGLNPPIPIHPRKGQILS